MQSSCERAMHRELMCGQPGPKQLTFILCVMCHHNISYDTTHQAWSKRKCNSKTGGHSWHAKLGNAAQDSFASYCLPLHMKRGRWYWVLAEGRSGARPVVPSTSSHVCCASLQPITRTTALYSAVPCCYLWRWPMLYHACYAIFKRPCFTQIQ